MTLLVLFMVATVTAGTVPAVMWRWSGAKGATVPSALRYGAQGGQAYPQGEARQVKAGAGVAPRRVGMRSQGDDT